MRAIFTESHNADSISTSVVASVQPRRFATHDAGERFDAIGIGDDNGIFIEIVGFAVEREEALARFGAAYMQIACDFRGIEHMQRPRLVDRQKVS